jgi:predicted N-acetyltransferase YhbS
VDAPAIDIVPLNRVAPSATEALLDRAFGPDRHARTAYRVRGKAAAIPALSLAAVEDGALLGTIQCWPVTLAGDDGGHTPLVMIGPVAVEPARQRDGIGRRLVAAALAAAATHRLDRAMMLIGDPEYYGRFFGFSTDATAGWRLPGPVEARRLLAKGDAVPIGPGTLGPAASNIG